MHIPRYYDDTNEVAYELYWKCTKCGWAIMVNKTGIGKDGCRLCGSPVAQLRVDYPARTRDITKVLAPAGSK